MGNFLFLNIFLDSPLYNVYFFLFILALPSYLFIIYLCMYLYILLNVHFFFFKALVIFCTPTDYLYTRHHNSQEGVSYINVCMQTYIKSKKTFMN